MASQESNNKQSSEEVFDLEYQDISLYDSLELLEEGNFETIIKNAGRLVDRYHRLAIVHSILGTALYMNLDYRRSIKEFEKALSLREADLDHLGIGLCFKEMRDVESAIEEFRKGVALKPDNPVFHTELALSYCMMGSFDKACEETTKSIQLGSKYYMNYVILSTINLRRENIVGRSQLDKAYKLWQKNGNISASEHYIRMELKRNVTEGLSKLIYS
jgi:tetratricopeptide (TPR) repeat protein